MADQIIAPPQVIVSQVVDPQTGRFNALGTQWAQRITTAVNLSLNLLGQFIGNIAATAKVGSRTEGIGTTLQNLDDVGVMNGPGVDFSRSYVNKTTDYINDGTGNPLTGGKRAYQAIDNTNVVVASAVDFSRAYINKTTDFIADGAGSPLAGGKAAQQALVASSPASGQTIAWSGTAWSATDLSGIGGSVTSTQVPVLSSLRGGVLASQVPSLSSLTGSVTAAQVPALSSLSGAITTSQLPAGVPTVSFGAGAPGAASTEGYIYFDTSVSPYQGYVYHSGAWSKFN